jgi:VPDSG-CTERM motif
MKANLQSILGIAVVSVVGALNSSASTISYDFGQVSGGATPAGTPPWVQAVFNDAGADTVSLTLTAGGLGQGSFVSCWYFNLNPSLDPKSLDFTVSGTTGAFTGPTIMTGANGFKAGPDGKFDILFGFATTGDDSALFDSGDSLTYTISGISGLTADDFNQLSTSAGGSGAYASAAHVQPGSDVACPAWINPTTTSLLDNAATQGSVPDASSTIALLGTSLAGIGILRRKFRSAR